MLVKIFNFCEEYPNTLALIVRKEFVDLRDSTLKDFTNYFQVKIDSNKEYHFSNGSVIMFRHGDELNVLKNLNLTIFGIEQAEEFETEETFTMLRDRLRRDNSPIRQGIVIANARGHNWIWKLWIDHPQEEFDVVTATTFENPHLPQDFVADLKRMKIESPNHYAQYVMNSFEQQESDDALFTTEEVYASAKLDFITEGARKRVMGVDIARFGEDETVFSIIESCNVNQWYQVFQDSWKGKSTMETVGKIVDLVRTWNIDQVVVDDVGVGGGVTDRLGELKINVVPFLGGEKPLNPLYTNKRSEAFFMLKELFTRRELKILPDNILFGQLFSIRYEFQSNGRKGIVSKDKMRKDGFSSPDRADALCLACYHKDSTLNTEDTRVTHLTSNYLEQEVYA